MVAWAHNRGAQARSPDGPEPWGVGRLTAEAEARFDAGLGYCERFFMGEAEVQKALHKLTSILESEGSRVW
jgi:hypothetical protein